MTQASTGVGGSGNPRYKADLLMHKWTLKKSADVMGSIWFNEVNCILSEVRMTCGRCETEMGC